MREYERWSAKVIEFDGHDAVRCSLQPTSVTEKPDPYDWLGELESFFV